MFGDDDSYECPAKMVGADGLAGSVVDGILKAPCEASVLFPGSGGNIHSFAALTPCAILDVLTPPYSEELGRPSTYFSDFPIPSLPGNHPSTLIHLLFSFSFLIFSFEGCGLIASSKSHPSVVAQAMLFSRKRISQMISLLLEHLTLGLELSPKMTFLDLGRHEVVCSRL
jgi:hypothetical protein